MNGITELLCDLECLCVVFVLTRTLLRHLPSASLTLLVGRRAHFLHAAGDAADEVGVGAYAPDVQVAIGR